MDRSLRHDETVLCLYAHPAGSVFVIALAGLPFAMGTYLPQAQAAGAGWDTLLSGTVGAVTVLSLWVLAFMRGMIHPQATVDAWKSRAEKSEAANAALVKALDKNTDAVDTQSEILTQWLRSGGHGGGG